MTFGQVTQRIDLSDGEWWLIKTVVTRGMRKAFRSAGLKSFFTGDVDGDAIDLGDRQMLRKRILAHPESWDLDAIDDAFLINGTVSWSFQKPITLETINDLPDKYVKPVLERMTALYTEPMEESLKNLPSRPQPGPAATES